MIYCESTSTPLGEMLLVSDENHLCGAYFIGQKYFPRIAPTWRQGAGLPVMRQAREELDAFFRGERRQFTVPLKPHGTAFQLRVWRMLAAVPYGATVSYGDLARQLGGARHARAVGSATGRNPLSVIVPCHRVLSASGKLTGYAGGLQRKHALLRLEGIRQDGSV